MSKRIYSRIAGTGSYLPEKVLTNDDLTKIVETTNEWIESRTGIRERHIAAEVKPPVIWATTPPCARWKLQALRHRSWT